MKKIQRIAVLLTCHNRREKTLKCLSDLYKQDLPPGVRVNVYLVDDGSTDGTGDALRELYPHVRVLQGNGHLYWCGGMRYAWEQAMKKRYYDAYMWLNDDTLLLPSALETMINSAVEVQKKNGHHGIIVGSCRDPETGAHTYGGRTKGNRRRTLLPDHPIIPGEKILPCDTMNGNLVLIPKEVAHVIGNLSKEYTHAFGDVDYGNRARQKGISAWICPGYQGLCARNEEKLWTNPCISLKERWRHFCSPLGLPPRQWYSYVRRHTGWQWPIYFMKPILRMLFPSIYLNIKMILTVRRKL